MAEHQAEVLNERRNGPLDGQYYAICICGWASQSYHYGPYAAESAELHERQDEPWEGIE